jgi:RHS repeat-associated protein
MLWLNSITETGLVGGSVSLPPVTFSGEQLANRVESASDGYSSLPSYRVSTITTETGERISVIYADPECGPTNLPNAPDTNTMRCFPQKWVPSGGSPRTDYFHKYVVSQVDEEDTTGGSATITTAYTYSGGGAWAYNSNKLIPDSYRTWSVWRGYQTVKTVTGAANLSDAQTQTVDTYFRGMDGDKTNTGTRNVSITDSTGASYPDSVQYAGMGLERETYDQAGGSVYSGAIYVPWSAVTAGSGLTAAHFTGVAQEVMRTADAGGGFRRSEVDTTFSPATGQPTRVSDLGDLSVSNDQTCTATVSGDTQTASGAWMVGFPSRVVASVGACGADALSPTKDTALSDDLTNYDGQANGVPPTLGDVTTTKRLQSYDASGNPMYQTTATTGYDGYGRETSSTIPTAAGTSRTDTTSYTMSAAGTLSSSKYVVDSGGLAMSSTTTYAPEWGAELAVSDPASHVETATYDPLGRRTAYWDQGQSQSAGDNPTAKYDYTISATGASSVKTSSLNAAGTGYNVSYTLYDSLLRQRETQAPSPQGGRIITGSVYDGRGLDDYDFSEVYDTTAPSGVLVAPSTVPPSETSTTFDGLSRPTNVLTRSDGGERWSTKTSYDGGYSTTVTPPNGAPSTTTLTDVRGQVVQNTEHGGSDLTSTYQYDLNGNLTKLVAPNGTFSYGYDLMGRQTSSNDPDSGATSTTYTADDQPQLTTDARGNTVMTTYDAMDRRTGLYDSTTADPAHQLAAWTYDTSAKGQPYQSIRYVGGASGTAFIDTTTAYTPWYAPQTHAFTISNPSTLAAGLPTSYVWSYGYNHDHTVAVENLPGAGTALRSESLTDSYNSLGMPTSVQGISAVLQGTTYDQLGRGQQYTIGQGPNTQIYLTNTFEDGTDRLLHTLVNTNASTQVFSNRTYTYNDDGDILSNKDAVTGDDQCFDYDGHDRLSHAWTPATGDCSTTPSASNLGGPAPYLEAWTYTGAGTRSTQSMSVPTLGGGTTTTTGTYHYNADGSTPPDAIASISDTGPASGATGVGAYGYDKSGDVTSRPDPAGGSDSLTWNSEGNLSTLTRPGGASTSYVYAADSSSLLLSDDGTTKTLYLDGLQISDNDATGVLSAERFYTTALGTTAVRDSNTHITFLVPDQQDTASLAVDGPTATASDRYFTPFGQARDGGGGPPPSWPTDGRGFLNAPTDASTGLSSVGERQYDAGIGAFLSPDPLLVTGSVTGTYGYEYGIANPARYPDPSGQMPPRDPTEYPNPDPTPPTSPRHTTTQPPSPSTGTSGSPDEPSGGARPGSQLLLGGGKGLDYLHRGADDGWKTAGRHLSGMRGATRRYVNRAMEGKWSELFDRPGYRYLQKVPWKRLGQWMDKPYVRWAGRALVGLNGYLDYKDYRDEGDTRTQAVLKAGIRTGMMATFAQAGADAGAVCLEGAVVCSPVFGAGMAVAGDKFGGWVDNHASTQIDWTADRIDGVGGALSNVAGKVDWTPWN